ncbi:hypothetical protein ACC782_33640 [Rhizobium ruizarguesonis]
MTQATSWSVPLVGPATPTVMAQRTDDSFDALLSGHSGSSRPSYAVAGTIWQDTSVAGLVKHYFYDGTDDILLYSVNTSTNVLIPAPVAGESYRGYINGLTLANNATDATNDIDIAAGSAGSDGASSYLITLASALTKRLDAAWAVGTNQGGLDTGSIANATYHVWLIQRSDTGVVDALFSTSATAPTMPTNYDRKRRIGSIIRESAAIVGFFQLGDFFSRGPKLDYDSVSALGSTTVSLGVPAGIRVRPVLSCQLVIPASSNIALSFGNGEGTGTGFVAQTGFTGTGESSSDTTQVSNLITNTSRQIWIDVTITSGSITVCRVRTLGWVDTRQ